MGKGTMRKEQAMKTRLTILEAALSLFKERDVDSVKVTDICAAAGVSVGAFYHHFPSKENIIERCYESIDTYILAQMGNIEYNSFSEQLLVFLKTANRVMEEEIGSGFIGSVYKYLLSSGSKCMVSANREPYMIMEDLLQKGVESGEFKSIQDVPAAASTLIRIVRGLTFDWCISEGDYSLTDEVQKTVGLVLKEYR